MGDKADKRVLIERKEWQETLNNENIDYDDLNRLVLNYLVIEGFEDAAHQFCLETGLAAPPDMACISDRMRIRNAIQGGRVEEAMQMVNDLDPEILDTTPKLFFHLQQQRLIELIRENNIDAALAFAQEELAPRGEESPQFLEELERTMALLAFEHPDKSPVANLLEHAQRQKLASEVNSAILLSQRQEREPRLPGILRLLYWGQKQLSETTRFLQLTDAADGTLRHTDDL